jgi:nickel-dependent lactate racemase
VQRQVVFGDSWITADFPDDTHVIPPGVSASLEPKMDLTAAVRTAFDKPLDLPPLKEFARGRSSVLIAFDDPTVPCYAPFWPTALGEILDDLYAAGVEKNQIQLRCANALHRKFTSNELASLIGDEIVAEFRDQLDCHDAEDPHGIVEIGTTKGGYLVELNRLVTESDLVIYLNASTTRGFSGGWKSICVGLSSYRSIRHHHTPDVMSMSMERNRMHEVLDEMGALD